MKKLLAIIFMLGLSVSAFAIPGCTKVEVTGGDDPMYNEVLGYATGTTRKPPAVEFYCKIKNIQPDETFYLKIFAFEPTYNKDGEGKSSEISNHMSRKSLESLRLMYEDAISKTQDLMWETKDFEKRDEYLAKLKNYKKIRNNIEEQLALKNKSFKFKSSFEYRKVWEPEKEDTILPLDFEGGWPAKVTSNDNGKEFKVRWTTGYGNRNGYNEEVAAGNPYVIAFCPSAFNMDNCTFVKDSWSFDEDYVDYIGTYEAEPETYFYLTADTLKISYGASRDCQIDMYAVDADFGFSNLSSDEILSDNLDEIIDEKGYLIEHRSLGIVPGLDSEKGDHNVKYETFTNIPSGRQGIYIRYIAKPNVTSVYGNLSYRIDGVGLMGYTNPSYEPPAEPEEPEPGEGVEVKNSVFKLLGSNTLKFNENILENGGKFLVEIYTIDGKRIYREEVSGKETLELPQQKTGKPRMEIIRALGSDPVGKKVEVQSVKTVR